MQRKADVWRATPHSATMQLSEICVLGSRRHGERPCIRSSTSSGSSSWFYFCSVFSVSDKRGTNAWIENTTIVPLPAERTSAMDWGTVLAGALITSALWLILFALGAGAGVASVSPYGSNNPLGTTLTMIGVAWFCIITIGSYNGRSFFRRALSSGC